MTYRTGFDRHQMQMLCWDDMIGPENPVRVIPAYVPVNDPELRRARDVLVDQLDLEALGFATPKNDQGGSPAYAAADLLKLYLYGYSNRLRSSRQLEHTCTCNMEVIWLLKGLRPKHSTIADFRSKHPQALKAVFRRYVALLQGWELVGGETIGIDSMKQRAQNSNLPT